MNTLKVGDQAPLFSLQNQNDETVELATLLKSHQVLVYFYPKALTPGCTAQAENLRDHKAELTELNTVAVGISPDPVKKLKNFENKKELNFDLLSDEDHAVADEFGVWGLKKFMGKEYEGIIRTTFIIDEKGKVERIIDKVKTKDHTNQII